MVVINCAYTEQINPAGATPVLTRDQVWNGLQRKIRKAQDFVPIITGRDVLEEKENEVTREAHFKERPGYPAHSVKEVCKSYFPTRVCVWHVGRDIEGAKMAVHNSIEAMRKMAAAGELD
ncbi:unnamed protein product [Zymoseptoria tritici ST99CH_3D7]|uniref:Uncharacterized protein n=1 Tax=Zymoseptoria tritici (strain ST99CH_3D7) TaxID=1276538 RepID=A0A1X7RU68_ZYMT9|nr:unnamed protein product [Zymoseptoria tritici ST99CH_3D7]